jgi:glucosamine--fructose-6-phosphate aminotransferase (isomerizing)
MRPLYRIGRGGAKARSDCGAEVRDGIMGADRKEKKMALDPNATKMWNEILEQPDAIARCVAANADKARAVAEEARRRGIRTIVIAARGTSDHAGVYGRYLIEALSGIPVSLAAPSVVSLYGAKMRFGDSLVIGLSQSGEALDVLGVIEAAKAAGAMTLGVTNAPGSPLAMAPDAHMSCEAGPEQSVAATKSFTCEMACLALLASELADDPARRVDLSALSGALRETIGSFDASAVLRYTFMDECFVLARGMNLAIGFEAALKIQETTYVRAKGFASSDFQHGPIAMSDKKIPVILFAPRGPAFPDMAEMASKMAALGVDTVVVTNDAELASKATTAFRIPDGLPDELSPFCNAAVAQMFACRLSLAKGLDPDTPRMLRKVTVTR